MEIRIIEVVLYYYSCKFGTCVESHIRSRVRTDGPPVSIVGYVYSVMSL